MIELGSLRESLMCEITGAWATLGLSPPCLAWLSFDPPESERPCSLPQVKHVSVYQNLLSGTSLAVQRLKSPLQCR